MKPNKNRGEKEALQVFCRLRPTLDESCIQVLSSSILKLTTPANHVYRNGSERQNQFMFKSIFTNETSQQNIFETVALPLVEGLITGHNGLLFTYGVTGGGKTYTMTGDKTTAGIMPRCVQILFTTIGNFQASKFLFVPDKFNKFQLKQTDDDSDCSGECKAKRRKLDDCGNYSLATISQSDIYAVPGANEDNIYAVFINFVEIYNNGVYDLLDESQMKLQTKIIREDILHNMFVHNVTEVEVKTPIEAINLFYKGKKRRRMASTYLNAESSRSHSIFTIRLVQAKSSQSKNITISQLSLVDLAGSERVNRTKNMGVRLREASQINNSLLNLRKCFEILRDNDNHKKNQLVPYRDNKLTHLFKMFFDGGGSIRMVVCVNPSIADYEETLHVLKFAEISQDVQVAKPIQLNFPTHNSDLQPNLKLGKTNSEKSWDSNQSSSELPKIGFDFDCEKIRILRFALEQRLTKRNLMKNKLKIHEQRLKEVAMDMEIQNVTKIIELSQSKAQVQQGTERIKSLGIKILDLEQEKVKLHDIIQRKDEQLNSQKYLLEEKSNLIKEAVVEKDVQKLEQQRLINEFKLQRENLRNYILTPTDESEHEEIPQPEILTHESRNSKPPFRQRRSRSVGNANTGDSWLEHRAGIPTELTTVFKPKVKKMKRLTKLTNVKDLTSSVNKYCLMTQESDSDGEIETKLLKADVIPTTTGGAQVVFNDVEILKRESPSRACRKRSCPTTPLRH